MMKSTIVSQVSNPPPDKPRLIFDGDCGFCRRWIARFRSQTGVQIDYQPFQSAREEFPEIPIEQFQRSIQFLDLQGNVFTGAEAAFRALAFADRFRWALWMYLSIPGVALIAELGYSLVARNRDLFSKLMLWFIGPYDQPASYRISGWLFLRLLALVYLSAFVSLWTQIDGLIGSQGILPANYYLASISAQAGFERFYLLPTLCWLNSSDWFLHALCAGGTLASILLLFNILPFAMLVFMWAFYLSLCGAGQDFLQYQWDTLLLETGLLVLFIAPMKWRGSLKTDAPPSKWGVFLMHWLLFRLMFNSGFVKIASGDAAWKDFTALTYHYFTQPMPHWLGWMAHQAPDWFHIASCVLMFAIELILPFFIFTRGRLRMMAFWGLLGLQCMILATGNYGFFNWLSIALCLLLLEDDRIHAWMPKRLQFNVAAVKPISARRWKRLAFAGLACAFFAISLFPLLSQTARLKIPSVMSPIYQMIHPFRSVNTYGLFAVMTTTRPEIILEGSMDGRVWKEYGFYWKAGDLSRAPRFAGPHMPRLDWQMWFASLGRYNQPRNDWFIRFGSALLEGNAAVSGLIQDNPFPDHPPKYLRALLYQYEFTDWRILINEGHWWKRELQGLYCPVLALPEKPDSV